jgi:hypothetical protein
MCYSNEEGECVSQNDINSIYKCSGLEGRCTFDGKVQILQIVLFEGDPPF